MDITNYIMDNTDEGYKRIRFTLTHPTNTFDVIVKETEYGATYYASKNGMKVNNIGSLTQDFTDPEREQLEAYIQSQAEMVHNFNH